MLKEHQGILRIQLNDNHNSEPIEVLQSNVIDDGTTIVIDDPGGFKDVEMYVKKHWMNEEAHQQNPTFIWDDMTKPQTHTIHAMQEIDAKMKQVEELELRAREYCSKRKVFSQVKRVQKSARMKAQSLEGEEVASVICAPGSLNSGQAVGKKISNGGAED